MNKINTFSIQDKGRLKWACRRGMLELDVLLNNFLTEAYPGLDRTDQELFQNLLSFADPQIFAWIMGHEAAPSQELTKITKMIRLHAQSRLQT